MLLDAFDTAMDSAISDMAQRPRAPKPQTPAFSAWSVVRGAGRSVPAGVAEAGASSIELMSGLSKVDISPETMRASQTEEGRLEMQRRAQETLETGFRGNDVSASLRSVAEGYMPDPLTAHGAEMAVAEFGRLGTKALTAGVLLGPVAGAIVSGAEEGFTEAEKLARQGVDVETRTKAGAVTGAITALGFALPVAGKTWAGTAGLAVAGGPASFMAQQASTRAILDSAGYEKLSDQYDPFDPVGLTLSTLVPFGFGAMAMRSAARAKGRVEPSPAAAVDEAIVDSARVDLLRQHVEVTRATPAEDLVASAAHDKALSRAIDQMADGSRVEVADTIPIQAAARIVDEVATRTAGLREELDAMQARGEIPEAASRVEPARYDIARLADEARGLLDEGRPVGEVIGRIKASGMEVSPELQNMLVGLSEFSARVPELMDQFRAAETRKPGAPVQDLVADAVEGMRKGGDQKAKPNPLQERIDALIVGKPNALDEKMPIAFDDQGRATQQVSMREYLDTVARESQQDAAEAELIQVAANCFLEVL
ncbi:hypothetical protein [Hydrogenophaga sp.]|uniref:hypothetical protein n=1 Tax=Hydrogenophaga sp. TaxID=1904254 RepID=UPI003F7034BC